MTRIFFKFFIGVFSFGFLLLIAALVAPFVVDLNKFKPQIQSIVKAHYCGDVDFSSARLTLVTGFGMAISDLSIRGCDEKVLDPVFVAPEVVVKLEPLSALRGNYAGHLELPQATFATDKFLGEGTLYLVFSAQGKKQEELLQSLKAQGTFTLDKLQMKAKNILVFAFEQIEKKVKNNDLLNVLQIFSGGLLDTIVQQVEDHKMNSVRGTVELEKEAVLLKSSYQDTTGNYALTSSVGFDTSLKGDVSYQMSDELKQKLLEKDKHFSFLFDDKGEFSLDIKVTGNIHNPIYNVEWDEIKARLLKHASNKVEKNSDKIIEDGTRLLKKLFNF